MPHEIRPLPRPLATIRRLWPTDMALYRAHLKRLDPDLRHARFGGAVSDGYIDAHVDTSLRLDTLIFGAFDAGQQIGAGELQMLFGVWPPAAEAAFSVEGAWQHLGIGDALMGRVVAAARNRGIARIEMSCLSHNDRMRHLALKHHAAFETSDGSTEAVLTQAPASPLTLVEEAFGEAGGLFHRFLDWSHGHGP